jgi:nucleoid-associated protein YgaU
MSRYKNTNKSKYNARPDKKHLNDVVKYDTTIYTIIPETNEDLFIITTEGDRLDNLAYRFYKNSRLWWYIAKANGLNFITIEPGTRLRIPASTNFAIGD